MVWICVTWDGLLVLLNPPQDSRSCRAGARPGHPITGHAVAIFRQINKGALHVNLDALEFPDGEVVLLTRLYEGQKATVLTLPTQPKTNAAAEAQQRVANVG